MTHKIINAVDEVKEKLTDNEYKNIVESVAELHWEKEESKKSQVKCAHHLCYRERVNYTVLLRDNSNLVKKLDFWKSFGISLTIFVIVSATITDIYDWLKKK